MVDAHSGIDGRFAGTVAARDEGLAVQVRDGDGAGLAAYAAACRHARFAPAQDPLWVESWAAAGRRDIVVATVRGPRAGLAMALEVERSGPFRIARFVGGSHANGNFPVLAGDGGGMDADGLRVLFTALRRQRRDIDALALERQVAQLGDAANPLLALPHRPSPNIALAASLDGGFDALLSRVNGKRKRKKYRSQLRKFEDAGGYRLIRAESPTQVDRLLDAFFAMRAKRFAAQGIVDVFAGERAQAAFRALYRDALAATPRSFFLDGLEVGGVIRAVTGASRAGARIVCDFCAFADDELVATSPGDFLFFENIRRACEEGFAVYDFSVGEERYKRAWCDIETEQFDVLVPLTPKGRLWAAGTSALSGAKRFVKINPTLWRVAKAVRRSRAQAEHPEAD